MLKKGKKKKEEAEKKTASDVEQQGKVSESDSAGAEANPGELISSLSETFEKNTGRRIHSQFLTIWRDFKAS